MSQTRSQPSSAERELAPVRTDRWLVLAPHPDDETLVAGGLLRRARAAGAEARVVLASDGENAPWIQRVHERRWRIGERDRARFGTLRRREVQCALALLGIEPGAVRSLGLRDQGLTPALLAGGEPALTRLAAELEDFRPTHVVLPSSFDLHPDHSALGVLARLALHRAALRPAPELLGYVVHSIAPVPRAWPRCRLRLAPEERAVKREAILCFATQLCVHAQKFLAFGAEEEVFHAGEGPLAGCESHPVRRARWEDGELELELRQRSRLGAFGATRLWFVTEGKDGAIARSWLDLGRGARFALRRAPFGDLRCEARVEREGGALRIALRAGELMGARRIFVKCERRHGFFDEAGWLELVARVGRNADTPARPTAGSARTKRRKQPPLVCAVIPCYDVASLCGPVVRSAAEKADVVLAIDDGSRDATGAVLREVAAESAGDVRVLALGANQGKGVALIEAFRAALAEVDFDVLVTLDGDGQHRALDLPSLVAAARAGADLVLGERRCFERMPARSRIGNRLTAALLRLLFRAAPEDTQTGYRALARGFVEEVVARVPGQRYETELRILLLALATRRRIATVPIPTLYLEGNRSSHFRPLVDSLRIYGALAEAWLAFLLQGGARRRAALRGRRPA